MVISCRVAYLRQVVSRLSERFSHHLLFYFFSTIPFLYRIYEPYLKFPLLSAIAQLHLSPTACSSQGVGSRFLISNQARERRNTFGKTAKMCLCCGNREGYDIEDANFGKSYNESFSTSQTAEVAAAPIVIVSQPTNNNGAAAVESAPDSRQN
uniref:Uncharacterized protein n=1 Tax=Anopheles farauti TaxID=69004 RepID=A0A182Q7W3_9DIPT